MCITGFLFHIVWSFDWELVAFLVLTVHVGLAIRLGEKVGIGLNFGYISHKTDKVMERKQKLFKSVDKIEKKVKKHEKRAKKKPLTPGSVMDSDIFRPRKKKAANTKITNTAPFSNIFN